MDECTTSAGCALPVSGHETTADYGMGLVPIFCLWILLLLHAAGTNAFGTRARVNPEHAERTIDRTAGTGDRGPGTRMPRRRVQPVARQQPGPRVHRCGGPAGHGRRLRDRQPPSLGDARRARPDPGPLHTGGFLARDRPAA